MTNQSTSERVKRSMVSMLLGRIVSAIGGIAVLLLLSRLMPQTDYGIYFAALAIVEIGILISNCGLIHAVYRYVGANVDNLGNIHTHGPIGALVLWRVISLLAAAVFFICLPIGIATKLHLEHAHFFALWIGLILIFEGMARYWEAIFDSMLLQGRSQITLGLRTLIRLCGILICSVAGIQIEISTVIKIELIATLLGALVGAGLLFTLKRATQKGDDQKHPVMRMIKFALPAFAAQVIGIAYGPDSLKLILANRAGLDALALFGFAFSLASVVQRYMPANLFAGIFRPMFVAAAKKDDASKILSQLIILSLKLNWILLIPAATLAIWIGDPLLDFISHGRYSESGPLLAIILVSLLPISLHLILGHYCLAIENSIPSLYSTGMAIIGLPLAYILAEPFSGLGIAVALCFSEFVWCATCLFVVKSRVDIINNSSLNGVARLVIGSAGLLIILVGLNHIIGPYWFVSVGIYILLYFSLIKITSIFSSQECEWIYRVIPKSKFINKIIKVS